MRPWPAAPWNTPSPSGCGASCAGETEGAGGGGAGERSASTPHHIVWFSRGGRTVIDNLVLLCRRHHGAVHEGGWKIEGDPAVELRFIRPNGQELASRPPPLREEMRDWLRGLVPSLGAVPRLAFDPE